MKMLLMILVLCMTYSCQEVNPEVNIYEHGLNTEANRQLVKGFAKKKSDILEQRAILTSKFLNDRLNKGYSSSDGFIDQDQFQLDLLKEYEKCSNCSLVSKDLMIPFLKKLFKVHNSYLVETIQEFEGEVLISSLDNQAKSNLLFLTYAFNISAEIGINQEQEFDGSSGFWDCFGEKVGSNAGEGMAYGFLGGCLLGGIAGGTGGTVLLPGVGTVTGAVAGCIYGGAGGAVVGGALGVVKTGLQCLFI